MPSGRDGKIKYYEKVHKRTNKMMKKDVPKKYK